MVDCRPKGEHFQDISRLQCGENKEYEFAKYVEAPRGSPKPALLISRRDILSGPDKRA